jgi:hypothetical protein
MWFGASNRAYTPGFTTSFPLTENPVSEGRWINGGTTGLDWQNTRTTPGLAFGVGVSAGYDDCIACVSGVGVNTTSHFAQGTCHRVGGYVPPDSHESELLVGWSISAHVAKGYEISWGIGLLPQPVRWNGAYGDFTVLGAAGWTDTPSGSYGSALVDGDVVKVAYAVIGGNVTLTLYRNGAQILTVQDTSAGKILSGQPGLGSFARAGATMSSYCWSSFTAG